MREKPTPDMRIRPARSVDAPFVQALVVAAYEHYIVRIGTAPGPMQDDYAARIAAGQVWVLEQAGAIAGAVVLEDGPHQFLLDNIAVHPTHQGTGLGRILLDFAEAEAIRRGRGEITLYTNALMHENLAIYQKRGYIEFNRRNEKGFDRVYMSKPLRP